MWCFYRIDIAEVPYTPVPLTRLTVKQLIVAVVSIVTVVFWFIYPNVHWLGNEGIVGLIPVCIFFGFNCVNRTDIAELPWTMILLVLGGGALGKAIEDSKLLELISDIFGGGFGSLPFFVKLLILTLVVAFVSIFVSHTVAAIVLIPIIYSILKTKPEHSELVVCSVSLPSPTLILLSLSLSLTLSTHPSLSSLPLSPSLQLMACALHVSPPMLLSVASFPNMSAFAVEDANHQSYLTNGDFFKYGGLVTILGYVAINSIFYATGWIMGL
jgi:phosphate transporter